jgi:hypothetical protein
MARCPPVGALPGLWPNASGEGYACPHGWGLPDAAPALHGLSDSIIEPTIYQLVTVKELASTASGEFGGGHIYWDDDRPTMMIWNDRRTFCPG